MNKGTIKDIQIYSQALQEEMQLLIYLPGNFTPLYKYSVLIASDGKDYFQLGRIPRVADELLEAHEMENLIIVGVPYKSVQDRRDKYIPSGEKHEAYMRFLAHELVPYIDEHYPTYQMGQGRGLIGDSMAGTASLLAAIQYPNIFGKVMMQSPLVNDDVIEKISSIDLPSHLSIIHTIGTKETEVVTTNKEVQDFLTPNRKLNKIMLEKGFSPIYGEFEGYHTWKLWQPDLKRILKLQFGI